MLFWGSQLHLFFRSKKLNPQYFLDFIIRNIAQRNAYMTYWDIRSPSDYDDTLEVSDSEISKSDQQLSVGGGMFSPSTDALSMSDSSTVTSSGNGGGLHLHSANALRSPQYAEQWASQDSIQSTGGLYTPESAAPNEYMTYPPLPSSTSNPTVDTTYHA